MTRSAAILPRSAWVTEAEAVAEILGLAPDLTEESVRAAIAMAVKEGTLPRRQFDPYISGLPYRGIQPGMPGSEHFVWKFKRADVLALFGVQDCAGEPPVRTAKAETGCRAYLVGIMRASPHRKRADKRHYWSECRVRFPRLSERAFDRAWTAAAIEACCATVWSTPGSHTKPPR
jgi:hypothetical protein